MDPTPRKDDKGKLDWNLLIRDMPHALESVCGVLHWAVHEKDNPYEEGSWKGVSATRYHAALMRHYVAIMKGEELDPESGKPHIAHVATNALILLHKHIES